ncbi:MAG: DRTGG domain-containing protein [Eubacteriales bacterium]|nr:DRTGG domain-containing protein [Eubacteriales bacterium]
MYLKEVVDLLDARVLTESSNPDLELNSAFSSDMLSHVLAYSNDKSILITALYNPQVLRTADLMGISCVIFIGRNEPDPALIKLANSLGLTIIQSPYSMYVTCGLLFSHGLQGTFQDEQKGR